MNRSIPLLAAATLVAFAGCAQYAPANLDPKTGQYGTFVEMDKSAFREYQTDVDPRKFRFVALTTNTNIYPARFEFFMRKALADLGMTRVLNEREFVSLVRMQPKLDTLTSVVDPLALRRITEVVGPVLVVHAASVSDGNARRRLTLNVADASTGKVLLRIEQNKTIWADADAEAHLPMLNALRQWYKVSTSKGA